MASNVPVACSLSPAELRVRGQEVAALFRHATQVRELADGFALAFPPESEQAHALLDFALFERACCPFFSFDIRFPSPHDTVWLEVRGETAEAKEMIRATVTAGAVNATFAGDAER